MSWGINYNSLNTAMFMVTNSLGISSNAHSVMIAGQSELLVSEHWMFRLSILVFIPQDFEDYCYCRP